MEEVIDAAKAGPCGPHLQFAGGVVRGPREVGSVGGGPVWLAEAHPLHHKRIERSVEYRHDHMVRFLGGAPHSITRPEGRR
ncbi:MAG: hypothetical protein F4X12_02010 [Acidobacteriia bacterium]|nr:hypothetical protein [Terriglobia bacterium]